MAKDLKEKLNALSIVWNDKSHQYEIANDVVSEVERFIQENTCIEVQTLNAETGKFDISYEKIEKIDSDTLNKIVWKKRTNINNKKKEIEGKRKQCVAIMINDFVDYCKVLESQLDTASNALTALINDYKSRGVVEETHKATVYKLTIKTESLSAKEKIMKYAQKLGCEVKE